MSFNSKIEWTQRSWNPITGCHKISPGCQHCYAERMALRLQAVGNKKYMGVSVEASGYDYRIQIIG